MQLYRRMPGGPIKATQWFSVDEMPPEVGRDDKGYYVTTIHGQRAYLADGDWILPEPDGKHFYPCKPDIFEATYEPASPPLMSVTWLDNCEEIPETPARWFEKATALNMPPHMLKFTDELQALLNSRSMENGSNTPDFILAMFLTKVLQAWDAAVTRRSLWYGGKDVMPATERQLAECQEELAHTREQIEAEGAHTAAATEEIERLKAIIAGMEEKC